MVKEKTKKVVKSKKEVEEITKIAILQRIRPYALLSGLVVILIISSIALFEVLFADKFFPRVFIGDTNLTFLTRDQAYRVLSAKYEARINKVLSFEHNEQNYNIFLASASASLNSSPSASINTTASLDSAFNIGHSGNFQNKVLDQIKLFTSQATISPIVNLYLDNQIEPISKAVLTPPQDAKLIINPDKIEVEDSKNGLGLDREILLAQVKSHLIFGQYSHQLPLKTVEPKVTTAKANKAKGYLENAGSKPITLKFNTDSWIIDQNKLMTLLDLEQISGAPLDLEKLNSFLDVVAKSIDQPVHEGQFAFDPVAKKVTSFVPSQPGQELDKEQTVRLITNALGGSEKNIELPVKVVFPKIKTSEINNMGIKELIGRGVSNFAGSIPNRIYNLNLAASRINGVLVTPGEEFSFNEKVGDISGASGYKPAYVIKSGRTVLDDGGGVCQVSSTIFRTILNSGLPITARTAHAYRVGYYEQGFPPGLDATIWAPQVDFKFKNDTPAHILIQAYTSGLTLYVDLYGTSDGRVAALTTPIVANQTPPLPELRQDDPTLPKGTIKQVDWAAWGANVSFKRTVTRNGETITSETWKSNYRPWQAIYLVGTRE